MNQAKHDFDYWPLFCEENIWQLCCHSHFSTRQTFAVFISNETKACTLWRQQSVPKEGLPVIWDYHVVLFACFESHENSDWRVWDLDSDLALGISAQEYLAQTFLPLAPGFEHYAPKFRIVDGEVFKARFCSDRQHMKNSDGSWKSLPPSWPVITCNDGLTLTELLKMDEGCLSLEALTRVFAAKKQTPT